eukprot:3824385-Pyramimonas_sp.AAC.1
MQEFIVANALAWNARWSAVAFATAGMFRTTSRPTRCREPGRSGPDLGGPARVPGARPTRVVRWAETLLAGWLPKAPARCTVTRAPPEGCVASCAAPAWARSLALSLACWTLPRGSEGGEADEPGPPGRLASAPGGSSEARAAALGAVAILSS